MSMRLPAPGKSLASSFTLVVLTILALVLGAQAQGPLTRADLAQDGKPRAANAYGNLPATFVANEGQLDKRVRYYQQGTAHSFYFTRKKAVLSFTKGKRGMALHLTPLGASPHVRLEAGARAPGRVNYLTGSERHTNLPTYHEVAYRELWPGIDLVFRGEGGRLKYEFHLIPGADPSEIALAYRGAEGLSIGAGGNLLIQTPRGTLRDSRPQSFQRVNGKRVPVGSRYALRRGGSAYGFSLGAYDPRRPLVIDPGLVYSTFLGGSSSDTVKGVAVDEAGNAYLAGGTSSSNFPVTPGAFDTSYNGGALVTSDAIVAKLNPAGSALVYATYLGGNPGGGLSGIDIGEAIAVDGAGNAYVAGRTNSVDFPVTGGDTEKGVYGYDAFVTKLNPSGSGLGYSTYLGGAGFASQHEDDTERASDIAVDGAGGAYVTGTTHSNDFPTTAGAADTTRNGIDAFVTKFSPGGALAYSTYLGGAGDEGGQGITVRDSRAYVTGYTRSTDFPITGGAYDTTLGGFHDAFVTKVNPTGSGFDYSTYLGGSATADYGEGIAVDGLGSAYVAGRTQSSDFPTSPGAHDATLGGGTDAFVSKLDSAGAGLSYSTLLGGTGGEGAFGRAGIDVDDNGSAWVTGRTDSLNFPTTPAALDTTLASGGTDAYVTKVDPFGQSLGYSSYMGGSGPETGYDLALGEGGNAYVAGSTEATDFPTTPGALDTSSNGGQDGFVTVVDDDFDDDGLPDEWETQGLTVGGDFIDLPAMGASPTHKDIFVEVDYMKEATGTHSHRPGNDAIAKVVTAFDNAPVPNPDSTTGIHLHVDSGSFAPLTWGAASTWGALSRSDALTEQEDLGTGAGTAEDPYDWTAFDALKATNFTAARRAVFHYSVSAHDLSPELGSTSGMSRALPASDFIVSLGSWTGTAGTTDEMAGTFMHELGHNLGLGHGGGDDVQWKPNYLSVMNYSFQTRGVIIGGGDGNFDYSRQALPSLNEASLDEASGIGTSTMGTRWFCGLDNQMTDPEASSVNWNCTGTALDSGVNANITRGTTLTPDTTIDTLTGYEDWPNLVYDGGAIGGLGAGSLPQTTVADEITAEEDHSLPDLTPRYPRPKGATPLRVPLVPAFGQCTSSNRTHGAPLAHPSCNPPQLASAQLTVGTPDANGHPANAIGFARFAVQTGTPGGVDDSDVTFSLSLTDVRRQGTLVDYTGELQALPVARITDRISGPTTNEPSTATDLPFPVTVPCTATGGTADVGATCAVTSSFDAVIPGAIPEGKRAIWAFQPMKVFDGGSDDDVDTAPNTLFAVQGLFVP